MQIKPTSFLQSGQGRRRDGYTLIEVLLAIFIAAVTASVLFSAFDGGFALLRTTREDLRATQILSQRTEAIRLFTWQDLTNSATTFRDYYNPSGTNAVSRGTVYTVRITPIIAPTNMPAAYQNQIQLVTISVTWTNYLGKQAVSHSRQMETLSAQHGMQAFLYGDPP
jgi:uncharacterized protein (TIGR02598 family)